MALEKLTGIVIDVVRHNEKHNVVTLFTRERGRVSFISPAGSGRTARMRNARLMPLAVITADVNFRESKALQSLGSFSPAHVWHDFYFDPFKSAIVMFVEEFLNRYLRDSSPEAMMWDYVYDALELLDKEKGSTANFHIAFLNGLYHFAGIYPDINRYQPGDYFDMEAGETVSERPLHRNYLPAAETLHLPLLLRMDISNYRHFRLNATQRREILKRQLQYYSTHFPGLSSLKSPEVLAEVFG